MLCKSLAKLHTLKPLQQSLLPFKNFNTTIKRGLSSINFEADYTSPNGSHFKILPLRSQDKDETCELLARLFVTREPLGICIELDYEGALASIQVVCDRAMEENLGTVFKDSKGRIVAANLVVDEYNAGKKPLDFSTVKSQKQLDIFDMLDECYPKSTATKENESYTLFMTGVLDAPELKNQKIARRTKAFMTAEHPILSKAKRIVTQATNPTIIILNKKMGWNVLYTYDVKTFKNKQGEFIFKDIDKVSQQYFGCEHPGINIIEYRPENNKPS